MNDAVEGPDRVTFKISLNNTSLELTRKVSYL